MVKRSLCSVARCLARGCPFVFHSSLEYSFFFLAFFHRKLSGAGDAVFNSSLGELNARIVRIRTGCRSRILRHLGKYSAAHVNDWHNCGSCCSLYHYLYHYLYHLYHYQHMLAQKHEPLANDFAQWKVYLSAKKVWIHMLLLYRTNFVFNEHT